MSISKRDFLKTLTVSTCSIPLLSFDFSDKLPRKYHKITKDWSLSCGSCTNWNDLNVYLKIGLSKDKDMCPRELDDENEYVLRSEEGCIYVNKDKCYEITDFKGEFIKDTNHSLYEASFNIIKYLGETPKERIVVVSGWDYCIFCIGRDYYKECAGQFGKGWTLDRREVYRPLSGKEHLKIRYFDWNRKTYKEYLHTYNTKLKELNLI